MLTESSYRRGHLFRLTLAALMLVAAGAIGVSVLRQSPREPDVDNAKLLEAARIKSVLAARDALIQTTDILGGGRLTVVNSAGSDAAVVSISATENPPGNQAFQVWLVVGDTPEPSTVLPAGVGRWAFLLQGLRGVDSLSITQEPATGSQTPSRVLSSIKLA